MTENTSTIKKWDFDYLYMFMLIIYMACMTPETSRMSTGGLREHMIGFLIPIVLTFRLLQKHYISYKNNNFKNILLVSLLWAIASTIKYSNFSLSNVSYMFFLIYPIIIAYIVVFVYKEKIFDYYEDILIWLCKFSLILWLFCVFFNGPARAFFGLFPRVTFGPNFLYLFHFMDTGQYAYGIMRNAGFSWEPGRFAIMVCLAIFINIGNHGIKFRANKNIWILLAALATTMSTTGYVICIVLYTMAFLKNFNSRNVILAILVLIPTAYVAMKFDFMEEKIREQSNVQESNEALLTTISFYESQGNTEHIASLDRFLSMYWEWQNFIHDPLLGYSKDIDKSYFRRNITEIYTLTGGLVKVLSQYGILFGLLLYYLLFKSSFSISKVLPYANKYMFAVMILLSSVSYPIFCIPIYTSLWLYGLFSNDDNNIN